MLSSTTRTRACFFICLCFGLFNLLQNPIGANAQQCTLPSRIFLPTPDAAILEQFGTSIDIDGNYMVAGVNENSAQQVYSGKVIVYKFGSDQQWLQVAELTPSIPAKYLNFGSQVAILGNTIVVKGREFNDDGISREKLYFFEKAIGAEWASTTESYSIAKPFGAPLEQEWFGDFDLYGDELVAMAYKGINAKIEIYTKVGGTYSFTQSISAPLENGNGHNVWNLAIGTDIIAIGTEQFDNPDSKSGAAFIYTKTAGVYTTSPKLLRAAEHNTEAYVLFGIDIAVNNSTVFVQGLREASGLYYQTFYVFEKPPGGWVDATLPYLLESPGYVQLNAQLVANENYLFSAGLNFTNVIGFKKPPGGWSPLASRFIFEDEAIAEKSNIGWQLKLHGNHLVAGCPNRFSFLNPPVDLILDFYSDTGNWEFEFTQQKLQHAPDVNATDDFFGNAFSVHGDQIAISAPNDDERGINSGVVYIFNTKAQGAEPDHRIFNPEQENYSGYGSSLAMGDSILFIGAPYKDSLQVNGAGAFYDIGKVYIYRLTSTGWVYSSQIKAPEIRSQVSFGRKVVWSPGYCAVTEFYDGSSESVGRVHIYKEDAETRQFNYLATLDPALHLRSDFFGQSMVMNDSLMVIGTGNFAPNSDYRLSAYVFKRKGEWKNATEDARLYSTDSGWSDRFGASVSIQGKYIVVGAPFSPGYDPRPIPRNYVIPGAAYIFKQPEGGWQGELTEIAKLTPSDPTEFGTFGASVAIDHNDIFIGSPSRYAQYNYADNFTNFDNTLISGKVYHFKKPAGSEWISTNQELRQLQSFEPDVLDGYGGGLFVSDRYLYVSAMLDDTSAGLRTGSVQTMMQLPAITEPPPVVCIDQIPFNLYGFPKNGTWRGRGVHPITGIFNPAVAGSGIHTIVYERSGCETSVVIEVRSEPLVVSQQSQALQVKCIGKGIPIVFATDRNPIDYKWYFKRTPEDEFLKFDSVKQTIQASEEGYYRLIINRGVCPDYIQEFRIMDEPEVTISIDPVPVLCDNRVVDLTATPTGGWWSGNSVSSNGQFTASGLSDGLYKVIYNVITFSGCAWKDSVLIEVDRLVQPSIEYNGDLICGDNPVKLMLKDVDTRSEIIWFGPDEIEISGKKDLTLTLDNPGSYYAEVSKLSCKLSTPPVEVGAVADSLFIPNVFTPNADNENDYFEARFNGIEDFQLNVINRYGQLVFETSNILFKWPATNVSAGVYFWSANYSTCWNKRKFVKGWIQIIK